jgi:WD40 repeat protein
VGGPEGVAGQRPRFFATRRAFGEKKNNNINVAPAPPPPMSSQQQNSTFLCPILGTIMSDPVIAQDGYTYERASISEWFTRHPEPEPVLSPLTGQALPTRALIPNHTLRAAIDEYCADRPERTAERLASRVPANISSHVDLQSSKVAAQEPWEFDKRALQQRYSTLIVSASRASLNKGTGLLQVWAQSSDAESFVPVAQAQLAPLKKSSGEASVACMELLSRDAFVAGNRDGSLQVWSLSAAGKVQQQGPALLGHRDEASSLAVLDEFALVPGMGEALPRTIVSGSRDRTVRLWQQSQQQWREVAVLEGHQAEVRCVAAVRDMGQVVSGGNDWDVLEWDAANPFEPIRVRKGHTRPVRCLASSGALTASGSEDESVAVWDPRARDRVAVLQVGAVALTAQWGDRFLAVGGGTPLDSFSATSENVGGWLRVWDARTWSVLGDAAVQPPQPVMRRAGSSSSSGGARAGGDTQRGRQAHAIACLCLRFVTLNGHPALVSGGDDKRIRIWGSSPHVDAVPFFPRPKLLFDLGGEPGVPISVDVRCSAGAARPRPGWGLTVG